LFASESLERTPARSRETILQVRRKREYGSCFSGAIIARGGEPAEVSREGNQENALTGDAPVLYLTYRLNTNDL